MCVHLNLQEARLANVAFMTTASPILRVTDADRALLWWQRLGFTGSFRHQFEPRLPHFVGIECDGCQIYLSEHEDDARGPGLVYLCGVYVDSVAA